MWNWQKIEGILNLPPFGKVVLLYWEKNGNKYATTGKLKSIDENGAHWSFGQTVDIFNMFTMASKEDDQPTHWCNVEIPVSEKSNESGLSEFELECERICDEILKTTGSLERITVLKNWIINRKS